MDHARKLRVLNIFSEAIGKAQPARKGVSARLGDAYQIEGVIRAQVTVASREGEFKLHFLVGANNEIAAWGPKGSIRCSLTVDSIESAIREEIERELDQTPFKGTI
jgi:hypothetical protein